MMLTRHSSLQCPFIVKKSSRDARETRSEFLRRWLHFQHPELQPRYVGGFVRPVCLGLLSGIIIPLIMQPPKAMAAQIVKAVSKLPLAIAWPAIREPSEMPKKSALLFQARTVLLRVGKSLASPACWAGKKNWATAELTPKMGSIRTRHRTASSSTRKQRESPARLTPAADLAPSRSASRPPTNVPAIAPHP
jgi:hypothetical protein